MRLIINLIMRVFGHYEPLETPDLIMIVSLIMRCIMRLLAFQCAGLRIARGSGLLAENMMQTAV